MSPTPLNAGGVWDFLPTDSVFEASSPRVSRQFEGGLAGERESSVAPDVATDDSLGRGGWSLGHLNHQSDK